MTDHAARIALIIFLLAGGARALETGTYAGIVQRHADVLLDHARDVYGPVHSPLSIETISPQTLEPYVWTIDPNERVVKEFGQPANQIMANFLFMQSILDTLRELTRLTGDPRYLDAARECAAFALERAVEPSGLIHWGKHATYDALSDQPLGHPGTPGFHYFTGGTFASWRFLYPVNPRAVSRHIEQQWNTTIDSPEKWRRIAWDLHPQYLRPYANPWEHLGEIDVDVKVPFAASRKMYPQIALELLYGAKMHSEYPGNDSRSWKIGSILIKRFEDARDPDTGLSPPMFAYAANPVRGKWFSAGVALRFHGEFDTGIRPGENRNTIAGLIVHTSVELYQRTKQLRGETDARPYLEFAAKAADAIVAETYVNGLFARRRDAKWARTASTTPMALLHLEAAIRGVELEPESVFCRRWVYRFTRNRDRQSRDNGHDWAIYTAMVEIGSHR